MPDQLTNLVRQATQQRVAVRTTPTAGLSAPSAPRMQMPDFEASSANMWLGIADAAGKLTEGIEKIQAERDLIELRKKENEIEETAIRLRDEYAFDPDGFEEAFDKYSATVLEGTEGRIYDKMDIVLGKYRVNTLSTLTNERRSRDRSLAADSLSEKAEVISNELKAMAFNGEINTDTYKARFAELQGVNDTMVNMGFVGREAADIRLDQVSDGIKAEAIMGGIAQIYEMDGLEVAEEALKQFVYDPENNFDNRDALYRRGLSIIGDRAAKDKKLFEKAAAEQKAALDLAISRAGTELEEKPVQELYGDIEKASFLSPSERTNFIQALDKKLLKEIEDQEKDAYIVGVLSGGIIDRGTKDHEDAANHYFEKNLLPELEGQDPSAVLNASLSFVTKTQIVPQRVQTMARGMLFTGTPDQQVAAADFVSAIRESAPQAIRDFGDQALQKAEYLNQMASMTGDPQEAVRLYSDATKVSDQVRSFRSRAASEEKHFTENRKFLEERSNRFDVATGLRDVAIPDAMQAEFDALQNDAYLRHGDYDASKAFAWKKISRTWAESSTGTGGGKKWVRHAPEAYVGPGEWIEKQMMKDVQERLGREVDAKRVRLVPDNLTARHASAGAPTYQVMVLNDDGVFEPVFNRNPQVGAVEGWTPDYSSSDEAIERVRENRARNVVAPFRRGMSQKLQETPFGKTLPGRVTSEVMPFIASKILEKKIIEDEEE